MAVQNSDILPYLLGAGAFVMLLLNPIYSWLASRRNLKGVLVGCYSFFILNLFIFIILWKFFNLSSAVWLSQIFYIWCNVYSFFVVSIFWVVIINLFRGDGAANVFGVIAAGGSLGAFLGSEISKQLAATFNESGIIFFTLISIIFLMLALATGLILLKRFVSQDGIDKAAGGTSFDALKNLISSSQIRSIGLYMYLWTAMMTIHWVTSIDIVNSWSSDGGNRIIFFSNIEQTVTILTLFTQFFLTSAIIRFAGPKTILMFYGFIFTGAFIGYYLNPSIGYVFFITIILRLFEYGINKPTREVVFSYLKQKEAITELFGDVATKIADRPGGYTRILKLSNRLGDNAQMALIELVDYNEDYTTDKPKRKKARRTKKKTVEAVTSVVEEAVIVEETATEEVIEAKVEEVTEEESPSEEK